MASYQIPQFLDSGDKILLNMNLRQFGYALGFGFLSFLVFQITFSIAPSAGYFSLIPAAPVALLGAYLALGKYNSRDAEVYVLAAILFNVKPRKLLYVRVPDLYDLEEKLSSVTAVNIAKKMKERIDKTSLENSGDISNFNMQNRQDKAKRILELANLQDSISSRTREKIVEMDIQKDKVIQEIKAKNFIQQQGNRNQGMAIYNLTQQPFESSPVLDQNQNFNPNTYDINTQNFFDEDDATTSSGQGNPF